LTAPSLFSEGRPRLGLRLRVVDFHGTEDMGMAPDHLLGNRLGDVVEAAADKLSTGTW